MKLTNCPACQKEISIKSKSCIHCGEPGLQKKFKDMAKEKERQEKEAAMDAFFESKKGRVTKWLAWAFLIYIIGLAVTCDYNDNARSSPKKAKVKYDQIENGAVFCTSIYGVKNYRTSRYGTGCLVAATDFRIDINGGRFGYPRFKHPNGQNYFTKSVNILYAY